MTNLSIATHLLMGTVFLYFGGEFLVKGAKNIARIFGVSPIVVGLTIVAFGTSLPELVVSLVAAMSGKEAIAIGNVIGSSLLNQLLVLGSCAVLAGSKGLNVDPILIQRDFPIMVITTLACIKLR